MPNIEVRDADGNLIRTYEIYADGYGTLITDEHLFELAKFNAIEDELVNQEQAEKLTFKMAE